MTGKAAAQRNKRGQMASGAVMTGASGNQAESARLPTAKTVSNEMRQAHDSSAAQPHRPRPPSF